ncbi:MAG: hypothetical protein IKB86_01215 [Clostridia bacterium]|nr:hypothetical protein [Clostridia bacterium]
MKKLAIIILVISLLFSFSGCGENKANIEYEEIRLSTINYEVKDNRARAEEKYIGMYAFVEFEVTSVSAKNEFNGKVKVQADFLAAGFYYSGYVYCSVSDENLQRTVLTIDKGDRVLVKGEITEIGTWNDDGEVYIDVHEIDFIFS